MEGVREDKGSDFTDLNQGMDDMVPGLAPIVASSYLKKRAFMVNSFSFKAGSSDS